MADRARIGHQNRTPLTTRERLLCAQHCLPLGRNEARIAGEMILPAILARPMARVRGLGADQALVPECRYLSVRPHTQTELCCIFRQPCRKQGFERRSTVISCSICARNLKATLFNTRWLISPEMICLAEVNERQLNVRRPLKSAIPLSTTTNRPAGALLIRCKTSTDYLIPGQITR